jgi:putative molybdenum carrier protein
MKPIKIVSGGQTGADRAALDWALARGVPCGGWCPKGRKAEDGPIDLKYPLKETPSSSYLQRTEWNVRDSDATVVFSIEPTLTGDHYGRWSLPESTANRTCISALEMMRPRTT